MTTQPTADSLPTGPEASADATPIRLATVLPFSRARFKPEDIATFEAVAAPKLRDGHWTGVLRESGRDHDRLLVLLPEVEQPVFRFERDAQGRYSLSFRDRSGWYGIGFGASAVECLSIWRPRDRRPS